MKYPECSVFWVPAVDIGSFENAYREIGRKLKVDRIDEDAVDVKKLVKAALSQEGAGTWLLVIDNADDTDFLFGHQRIVDYLPFSRMGSILFTTRNHEAVVRLDIPKPGIIRVAEMGGSEALELLKKSLKEDQMDNAESTARLLEFLANLPLAIRQASAYMAKTGMSTKKYLDYCQASDEKLIKLLSKDFEDRARYEDSGNAVATTWLISFKLISRDSPVAACYLEFICFFAEKDIPMSLLPQVDDELDSEEAMGTLKAYAFITQREGRNSFDIHRLVRLTMQNWLKNEGKKEERVALVVKRMVNIYPSPEYKYRDVWMSYLPHVQAVLSFCKDSVDAVAVVKLLLRVGFSLYELLNNQEAEDMLRTAVNLVEQVLGGERELKFSCMNNLAVVLQVRKKYEEAEQIHRQIFRLREKLLGRDKISTIDVMINLASVLNDQMKFEEAEQLTREALELCVKLLGREDPRTLKITNNLAVILMDRGSFEEGARLHLRTLKLREKVLDKEHPDTLQSMANVATAFNMQKKFEEAEHLSRQAIELQEKTLSGEHPLTLKSIAQLIAALNGQREYEEAEKLGRQTLNAREKMLGREHPSTLPIIQQLIRVLNNQGNYEEAEQMLWRAIELAKRKPLDA